VLASDDQERLLGRVRAWFDAPEQVQHYRAEASQGFTPAEDWLLTVLAVSIGSTICGKSVASCVRARRCS
jgi:hypothetical protein